MSSHNSYTDTVENDTGLYTPNRDLVTRSEGLDTEEAFSALGYLK
jgi:hypothetical protein